MKKLILTLVMGLCAMAWAVANINHIVEPGETLKSIAQKYGVTEAKIIELNPDAAQFIYVGMELNIPANAPAAQATASSTTTQTAQSQSSQSHDVEPGMRIDSDGNLVYHSDFLSAQYQCGDFDEMKLSGSYGIGWYITSISHWGRFHVGANLNFGVNYGIASKEGEGGVVDFGPSIRLDITDHCFINMPINAAVACTYHDGNTDTSWGAKIMPALHVFPSNRFGIFIGPQITFGDGATSFGGYAGISYSF